MPCTYAYHDVFFSIHSETKRWTKHFLVMQYFYWLNNFILWLHLVACHWQQLTIFIHLSYIRNCFIARKTIWQFPAGLAATTAQFVSSDFSLINNPLCAKCFIGNIKMSSQFISLLHTDMTQVVKILLYGRQEFTYSTYSILWVLRSWRRKEPGRYQPCYWLYWAEWFGPRMSRVNTRLLLMSICTAGMCERFHSCIMSQPACYPPFEEENDHLPGNTLRPDINSQCVV